jgi:hypothetical protein
MKNDAEQEALFEIEGPDEEGCVWICSKQPTESDAFWCQNLGPIEKVAEVLSKWLVSLDLDEREGAHMSAPELDADEADKRQAKKLRKLARPQDHRDEGGQG